jgi:hypothetical protein
MRWVLLQEGGIMRELSRGANISWKIADVASEPEWEQE